MDRYIDKASQWGFNNIEASLEITRFNCKEDQIGLAEEVIRRANQRGLYVTVRMGARRKPTQPNQSSLYFQPTQEELDSYVEFWREAGRRFRNNPGVAAVQLYNELDYTRNVQGDWRVIAQKRGEAWRTLVEPYNLNACNAVREGSPNIICTMVSGDANIWFADTWNFNLPFTIRFPPPNSMIAFHPYNITIQREKVCEKPPSDATWWCYPVNRQWENFVKQGKAIIFSETGYFETGSAIGEPYVETIDDVAIRLKVAEDLKISWNVLGPFWSWKDGKLYWVEGPNSDDALWAKVLQPLLSR